MAQNSLVALQAQPPQIGNALLQARALKNQEARTNALNASTALKEQKLSREQAIEGLQMLARAGQHLLSIEDDNQFLQGYAMTKDRVESLGFAENLPDITSASEGRSYIQAQLPGLLGTIEKTGGKIVEGIDASGKEGFFRIDDSGASRKIEGPAPRPRKPEKFTPSDVVAPILAKVSRGENLTPGEQRAVDLYQRLDPMDIRIRNALQGAGARPPAPAAQGAPSPANQQQGTRENPVSVSGPDEARSLPSGTWFTAPDGVLRQIK